MERAISVYLDPEVRKVGPRTSVPGLLCYCVLNDGLVRCSTPIHGTFTAELEHFESDYLPDVLDVSGTSAVRVEMGGGDRRSWTYWAGSDQASVVRNILASEIMEF